mgnify:CR=1 FL=1
MTTPEAQKIFADVNQEFPANPAVPPSAEVATWGKFVADTLPVEVAGKRQAEGFGEQGVVIDDEQQGFVRQGVVRHRLHGCGSAPGRGMALPLFHNAMAAYLPYRSPRSHLARIKVPALKLVLSSLVWPLISMLRRWLARGKARALFFEGKDPGRNPGFVENLGIRYNHSLFFPFWISVVSADSLVRITDVNFSYDERAILKGINMEIPRGKLIAIMGNSGCGKTTLLRLIGGQLRPTSGQLLVDGQSVPEMTHDELYAMRRRMGMLFQFGALFTDMSVLDNVAFPLREHTDLPEALVRDIALMKLHAVGLRGARDLMPSQISGGMARRVALARAMALDPELVMYDEPFAGLDPISLGTAAQLIRKLNDALGITSIVVSHDVQETFLIADQVIILADGRVAAQGTPDEVRASTDPLVRQFVGMAVDGPVQFHYPGPTVEQDFGIEVAP